METNKDIKLKGIKRLFYKLGGCSHLYFYIINRHFGHPRVAEERASDLLAGGIMQQGYQCGMLWGASLATGAEAYRRFPGREKAIALAILATRHIMDSFERKTTFHDCYDITNCDWEKKSSIMKYFVTGKMISCFKLAEKWAPEAVQAAIDGLEKHQADLPEKCISCATETALKMGATDEQSLMVAGFAGGLGLSGNACGALSAAIWMHSMAFNLENPGKVVFRNPPSERALEALYRETNYEILCSEITGTEFNSPDAHTTYIENGGCEALMAALANS